MDIYLYNSLAEPNRVNKISYLTYAMHLEGTLRSECSIITPYIQIEVLPQGQYVLYGTIDNNGYVVDDDNKRVVIGEDLVYDMSKFNYAYIPQFNRYYFINDIISIRNTVWGIDMQVDTLMTYKDSFKNMGCFIDRQENIYNTKLPDNLEPCLSEPLIIENKGQESPFILELSDFRNPTVSLTTSTTKLKYIENIMNPTRTQGSVTSYSITYLLTLPSLQSLYDNFIGLDMDSTYKQLFNNISDGVQKIMSFPLNLYNYYNSDEVVIDKYVGFGNVQIEIKPSAGQSTVASAVIPQYKREIKFNQMVHIPYFEKYLNYNDYILLNPYTKIELFIPYLGWVGINADLIYGMGYDYRDDYYIDIIYNMSIVDGSTTVNVYRKSLDHENEENGTIYIGSYSCQIGEEIPMSSGDYINKNIQRSITAVGGVLSSISGGITKSSGGFTTDYNKRYNYSRKGTKALTSIKGGVTKTALPQVTNFNPIGMVAGIVNTVGDVLSTKNEFQTSSSSSNNSYTMGLAPKIRVTTYKLYNTTLNVVDRTNFIRRYLHTYGKPCQQYLELSKLKGFTKVSYIHLEGIPNATQGELEELEEQLVTGVLL